MLGKGSDGSKQKGTKTRGLDERKVVCGAKERASVAEQAAGAG
jgi:hypothetical protein